MLAVANAKYRTGRQRVVDMMAISESHAAHIGRVKVAFWLSGAGLDPSVVSGIVGIPGDFVARAGEPRMARNGAVLNAPNEAVWRIDSSKRVQDTGDALKDINEHLRSLLQILLPHREALTKIAQTGSAFFDVLWESSYLYAGTGPVLEADCIRGIADLGAGVGFDIYQIEEPLADEAG
jgi:hypothetical protein